MDEVELDDELFSPLYNMPPKKTRIYPGKKPDNGYIFFISFSSFNFLRVIVHTVVIM